MSKKLLFLSLYNNYDSLQMIFYPHTIDIFSIASDKNVIIMNNMNMKQKLYYWKPRWHKEEDWIKTRDEIKHAAEKVK